MFVRSLCGKIYLSPRNLYKPQPREMEEEKLLFFLIICIQSDRDIRVSKMSCQKSE